jgi:hypothetical protein
MQYKTVCNNASWSFLTFILGAYLISQDFRSPLQRWTINYPANAWSSALYAFPIAPLSIKIPLLILSIVSFGLWSNETVAINYVDVTSIYWVIILVSTGILPGARHRNIALMSINGLFAAFITTTLCLGYEGDVLNYYHANLVPITGTIMVISTINTAAYYAHVRVYLLGAGMIVTGFGFKLLTIYCGQEWGTCIFHTSTAGGIAVLLSPRLALALSEEPTKKRDDMFVALESSAIV